MELLNYFGTYNFSFLFLQILYSNKHSQKLHSARNSVGANAKIHLVSYRSLLRHHDYYSDRPHFRRSRGRLGKQVSFKNVGGGSTRLYRVRVKYKLLYMPAVPSTCRDLLPEEMQRHFEEDTRKAILQEEDEQARLTRLLR